MHDGGDENLHSHKRWEKIPFPMKDEDSREVLLVMAIFFFPSMVEETTECYAIVSRKVVEEQDDRGETNAWDKEILEDGRKPLNEFPELVRGDLLDELLLKRKIAHDIHLVLGDTFPIKICAQPEFIGEHKVELIG
jgi:hypothetical protein